jgi:hypothetical protein
MSLGGFTLADRLGAKTVPCRVSGCTRTWVQLGGKALALGGRSAPAPDDPGSGMCEPCKKKFAGLTDKQRRCDVPGCTGTWTWPVMAQLEAFATHRQPPKNLCASCVEKLASLEDKQIPCNIPGCTRSGTLTKRAQLLAEFETEKPAEPEEAAPSAEPAATTEGGAAEAGAAEAEASAAPAAESGKEDGKQNQGKPEEKHEKPGRVTLPGPYCDPCADVIRRLTDRPVHCGIAGCKRKWLWKADDQIQAFAAGKPNEPPRRMCDGCRASFGKLTDREVRCRTSGCKKTWTWSRFDQLDACVADKPPPKAPARMCDSCYDIFQKLKDVERPCRKAGCKRTWTDKRGAQLARQARGKTGDPYPQYCVECQKELGDLDDREVPCKAEGCPGTWTWTREQQLAAGVRPVPREPAHEAPPPAAPEGAAEAPAASEAGAAAPAAPAEAAPAPQPGRRDKRGRRRRQAQPPERLCAACAEFLKDKKTLEIPCSQCATPIYWPPESQLQTHLGHWAMPSLCGACKRDATEAARIAAKEAIRAQAIEASNAAHATAPPPAAPSGEQPS